MLQDILVCSKVLQDYYQHAHWTSKNTVFYSDHLLFSRLYDEAGKNIDGLAEKLLGIGQPSSMVDTTTLYKKAFGQLKGLPYSCKENVEYAKAALPIEEMLISYCVQVDEDPKTSLGVKNFVGQIADEAEGRVYLLKQRINKGVAEKPELSVMPAV
jgi:DNA-binding ferritin-like protein